MSKGYLIATLGCRANRFESDQLAADLEGLGYQPTRENPEIVVINTCTVTHKADKQGRQLIRKLARAHPGARVVVTGCLAQLEGQALKGLAGVDLVLDHAAQGRFKDLIEKGDQGLVQGTESSFRSFGPLTGTLGRGGRTRALLKVQDGCDNACAYCRVTLARGPSRSLGLEPALSAAQELASAGHQEIVLTGIHLGSYGRDLDPPTDLTELLTRLLKPENGPRIRLSSLDPDEIDRELLSAASSAHRFCPHFHLPLQSGDGSVLARMNRSYSPESFAETVRGILNIWPLAGIGADVIVGFPGEDEPAFRRTYELIESLGIAYLHVFPFSPRTGTPAAELPDRVDPAEISARAKLLRELGTAKRTVFLEKHLGRELEMLVESRRDPKTGMLTGLSPNYLGLLLDGGDELINHGITVRAREVLGRKLVVEMDN